MGWFKSNRFVCVRLGKTFLTENVWLIQIFKKKNSKTFSLYMWNSKPLPRTTCSCFADHPSSSPEFENQETVSFFNVGPSRKIPEKHMAVWLCNVKQNVKKLRGHCVWKALQGTVYVLISHLTLVLVWKRHVEPLEKQHELYHGNCFLIGRKGVGNSLRFPRPTSGASVVSLEPAKFKKGFNHMVSPHPALSSLI